ncbi:PAS domain S-box protein [Thiohalocapsa sp. ML1]|jgi:PAS domain S-box-containing protein|uniref:PAS domain S-box protein n=1 Tax=Thiohalocapsa sp. ML1 TaxID=1431688 RepID=UPI0007323E55|nr:PAS domain S-box protein [Thiohalocapsa sp. ML1]
MIDDNDALPGHRRHARADAVPASSPSAGNAWDAGNLAWRHLLERIADAVVGTDGGLRVQSWPAAAEAIYGWPAEQALGRHIDELLRAEPTSMRDDEALDRLQTQGFVVLAAVHHTQDGRRRYTRTHVIAQYDNGGALAGTLRAIFDVTNQRLAEDPLRESAERVSALVEAAAQAVWETDPAGKAVIDSPTWRAYTGQTLAQSLGWGWLDAIHPDDRAHARRHWEEAVAAQRNLDCEYRLRGPNGDWRWTNVRAAPLRDGDGRVRKWVGMNLDISERKAAEAALEELNHTLEARIAARTAEVGEQAQQLRALATELARVEQRERQRLATILHEQIQQLIVAAQMQTGVIAREADTERLRQAASAAQQALAGALETSRSLTLELSPPVLKDAGLIDALAWLAERMETEHGCRLDLHAEPDAEPADEELRYLLFACASELLRNIAKHAGVDQAELSLRRPGAGSLVLGVADQGRGFDPVIVTRRRTEDTGFGLFSIRERLAHLGGRMDLDSAPGRGTRVTLTLPATMAQVKATAVATTRQAAWAHGADLCPRLDALRVLIVDDHQIMRQGLAGLLRFETDIEVIGEADSGEQALARAAELNPDVVIMDVNLGPGMDGIEATRRLLAARPALRIIGLSMHLDSAVANAMRDAGAVAYLSKGGPCEELVKSIREQGLGASP